MFTIEILAAGVWTLESGDYFLRADGTGGAIATARGRYTRDDVPRRVMGWPGGEEVWTFATQPKRKQRTA